MVIVTFRDFTSDDYPVGGERSILVEADPYRTLEELDGGLSSSSELEVSEMNWVRARDLLKENMPGVRMRTLRVDDKHYYPEILVELPDVDPHFIRYPDDYIDEGYEEPSEITRIANYIEEEPVVVS